MTPSFSPAYGDLVTMFWADQLLDAVWGADQSEVLDRTVDVHVRRLRMKLGDEGQRILDDAGERQGGFLVLRAPIRDAAGNGFAGTSWTFGTRRAAPRR